MYGKEKNNNLSVSITTEEQVYICVSNAKKIQRDGTRPIYLVTFNSVCVCVYIKLSKIMVTVYVP